VAIVDAKNEDVDTPILDEEDEATLAAIDRGIQFADEGRVVPLYKFGSEDALNDREIVLDYMSADNPAAAEQFGTSLVDHVDLLGRLLGSGFQWQASQAFARFFRQSAFITGYTRIAG
jgi:plasmid stabilization system protein ParE